MPIDRKVDAGSAAIWLKRSGFRLLQSLLNEPLSSIPPQSYESGTVFSRALGRIRVYLTDPEQIQDVFVRQAECINKGDQGRVLKPALGTGVLTADGADWRWQRRAMSPGFAHARLQSLASAMIAAAEASRDTLVALPPGSVVDVGREMARVTLRIVGDTMLACASELDPGRVERGIADFMKSAPWGIALTIVRAPSWMPYPGSARSKAAAAAIRGEIVRAVAQRRERRTGLDGADLMALLLAARDPDGNRGLTNAEVTDNVVTFVMAGHETTSVALTWALNLLARHKNVATRVRAEIETVTGGKPLAPDHVAQLAYTKQVVNETMRLYPPAPIISREVVKPLTLAGVDLPVGSVIILPIHAVHHHRALWEQPEIFDPDRFAPERVAARHRYAFMPFGVGPRICIGSAFASMEAIAILAVLVRALDLAPVGPAPVPMARLTLRPRTPVLLEMTSATRAA